MKKSIKDRWVKALRSGKYEQGHKTLKTSDGKFCCLGVLTDLYLKEKKKGWVVDSVYLPVEVRKWSGMLSSSGGYENSKGKCMYLSDLNDLKKLSFKQIANIIDKVWERL